MSLKEWIPIVIASSKDPISAGIRGVISENAWGYAVAFIFILIVVRSIVLGILFLIFALFAGPLLYVWQTKREVAEYDRGVAERLKKLEENRYRVNLDKNSSFGEK